MIKTSKLIIKKVSSITLLFISLYFAACSMPSSSDNAPAPASTAKTSASVVIPGKVDPDSGSTTVEASLQAYTFDDATQYRSDIAISSLCLTIASEKEEDLRELFTDFEFDNIETYNAKPASQGSSNPDYSYDNNDVSDSISYGLAHYKDGDYDVVVVAVRSGNYGAEWGSNFNLGESGDHLGFSEAAQWIYTNQVTVNGEAKDIGLKGYIERNYASSYANKTLKIWISGYSRGAAVSNVLAYYILTGLEGDTTYKKFDKLDEKDVFVYTFATPKSLISEHAIPYINVFNHVSRADLVTYVAPFQYGFYRCGQEILLFDCGKSRYKTHKVLKYKGDNYEKYEVSYTSDLDEWLKEFNSSIDLPKFCIHDEYTNAKPSYPGDSYQTEEDCIEFFFNLLLNGDESKNGMKFNSREKFVTTAQPTIQYVMTLYMQNKDKFPMLIEKVKSNIMELLTCLSDKTNFYNWVKSRFTEAGITYDSEANLKTHCDVIFDSIDPINQGGYLSSIVMSKLLPIIMGGNTDFTRIFKMHYPEVTFVTLLKYLGA